MFPKPEITNSQAQRYRRRTREYQAIRKAFMAEPKNFWCARCRDIATEVHHVAGRAGTLLTDPANFLPTCPDCHRWIHANPAAAREKGWLKSRNQVTT